MQNYIDSIILDILNTIKKLVILLKKENKALKTNNLEKIDELLLKKQELLNMLDKYNAEVVDKEKVKLSNKVFLDELIFQNNILQREIYLNESLIKIKLKVNKKFLMNLKNQINLQYRSQIGYNKKGDLLSDKKLLQIMPSISINNKI